MPAPVLTWHVVDTEHYALEAELNRVQGIGGTIVQVVWCAKDGSPSETGSIPRHFMIIYTIKA